MPPKVEIVIEAPAWRRVGAVAACARAAIAACMAETGSVAPPGAELSLLLCDDAHIRQLNRDFRGLDRPTNVLSFAGEPGGLHLGDIAIAVETVKREAMAEAKSPVDHYVHLVTHGLLHILGYDHETDVEADIMEAVEIRVLKRLGIADPYGLDKESTAP